MAKLSDDKKYVIVEEGDTLTAIAREYGGGESNVQRLADINGISDPNVITIEQKIMLAKNDVSYFKKYTGSSKSIVDALRAIGEKSTYSYRREIAKLNNITPYSGTAAQNSKMLSLLKQGKLIKAGTASSTSSSASTNAIVWGKCGRLASDPTKLYVTWTWHKESDTESYKVVWEYKTKEGIWFTGNNGSNSIDEDHPAQSRQSTYDFPDGAISVRVRVKPIAETKKKNDKDVPKFEADWSDYQEYTADDNPPEAPSAPSVEIEKYQLTASFENIDLEELNATHIKFQIVKNDTELVVTTKALPIDTEYRRISYDHTIEAGNEYKVRCMSVRGTLESDWSDFSSVEKSIPSVPEKLTCKAAGKSSNGYFAYLTWDKVNSAETYDVQYSTKKEYFDSNAGGERTDVSTEDDSTEITIYNIGAGEDGGAEYFFRVRATNEKGSSNWSSIVSVKIGEPPAAPTTWSSTTTAIIGEPLKLYWVHNSEDGSSQTKAKIVLDIDGFIETHDVNNDAVYGVNATGDVYKVQDFEDDSEKDLTSSLAIDTTRFDEGVKLKWQVSTAGVTNEYGKLSTPREVDIYAPPTLDLSVTDSYEILEDGTIQLLEPEGGIMSALGSFPFYVKAVAGPKTQSPIGYHLRIVSNMIYETVDSVGKAKTVSAGEEVYSKYFDITTPLMVEFSAGNLDLENGVEYTINCSVSMNSGLTAEAPPVAFTVSWADMYYAPNAEISINEETYSASIRPYCEKRTFAYFAVSKSSGSYSVTSEEIAEADIDRVYTETGEKVLLGKNSNGSEIYYCPTYTDKSGSPIDPVYYIVNNNSGTFVKTSTKVDLSKITKPYTTSGEEVLLGVNDGGIIHYCLTTKSEMVEDVTLAVYRREFDGGFTEIGSGIDNTLNTFLTDPHPALDYARYRIVAKTNSTGAVSYYDMPGISVGGKEAIIQWAEEWSSFDSWSENPLSQPTWAGSMLKLKYNIDVSDNGDADVSHVKYIGRSRPVAYYGTQLGETSSWTVEVPKDDEETIYSLRRLQLWMGDVYVREPSGTGYWATIKVSFSTKHKAVTIPVSISLTRVEGGI